VVEDSSNGTGKSPRIHVQGESLARKSW